MNTVIDFNSSLTFEDHMVLINELDSLRVSEAFLQELITTGELDLDLPFTGGFDA